MNFYGSEQFKKYDEEKNKVIFSHIDFSLPYSEETVDGVYTLKSYYYTPERRSPHSALQHGEICRLYKGTELFFEWKCYDGCSKTDIIDHSNGKKYLIFREGIYGYAVLDLETGDAVHYLPWESFQSGDSFKETFLWLNVHYDKSSDLIAVFGCFWGEMGSVIVLDFSDPMKIVEADKWIDISDLAGDHSTDCNFVSWEKDRLVCTSFEIEKKKLLELTAKTRV